MPTTHPFRYFAHPHDFSTYEPQPQACALRGTEGPGYRGPFYGTRRGVKFVCEDCLGSGALESAGLSTNDPDRRAVVEQLRALHPGHATEEITTLANAHTAELAERTPHPITWQDFFWPAHCGDHMCFDKEVGQPEITLLAPGGDGLRFCASHAGRIEDLTHGREVWEGIQPDMPENVRNAYSIGVYLFRCLICDAITLLWDCD